MTRRLLIAGLALLLAVAAGGGAYLSLRGIQRRAYHDATLVPVYRVDKTVPAGTPASALLSQGLVGRGQIPEQYRPAGAVTNLSSIQGELATAELPPGQVLDSSQFSAPASVSANTPAALIPKGDVAISVAVDLVHGVSGLVQPGDEVDILVEVGGSPGVERFLYQDVQVLAVGTSTVAPSGVPTVASSNGSTATPTTTVAPSAASGLITFAVPPAAAQRIALAESDGGGVEGELYLALVPSSGTTRPAPYPAVGGGSLFTSQPTP